MTSSIQVLNHEKYQIKRTNPSSDKNHGWAPRSHLLRHRNVLPATKPLIKGAEPKSRFKFNRDNSPKVYASSHQEVICHPSSSFHATSAYPVSSLSSSSRLPRCISVRKLEVARGEREEGLTDAGINFRNYRRVSANAYIIGHRSVPPSPPVVNAWASVFSWALENRAGADPIFRPPVPRSGCRKISDPTIPA